MKIRAIHLHILQSVLAGVLSIGATVGLAGCGAAPPIPNATDLTLERLGEIQNDERLTDDERRDMIRELVGAENNAAGDRLVDFLLNFNIP